MMTSQCRGAQARIGIDRSKLLAVLALMPRVVGDEFLDGPMKQVSESYSFEPVKVEVTAALEVMRG